MVKILQPIQTTWLDYPDDESLAIIVCMMGCDNGCPFCQNPEFQNPEYNNQTKEYNVNELINELKLLCKKNHTNKVVLSGGDPLSCFNKDFTKELLSNSDFEFCIYTGHNIEYVKSLNLFKVKFIKCGYFDINKKRESFKNDLCIQFASPNQILYNGNYEPLSVDGVFYFKKS